MVWGREMGESTFVLSDRLLLLRQTSDIPSRVDLEFLINRKR